MRTIALLLVLGVLVVEGDARMPADGAIRYRLEPGSTSVLQDLTDYQIGVLEKLNRADRQHLPRLPQIVTPETWVPDENVYSPMPAVYDSATELPKFLVVALDIQAFGGYERGRLVRWGAISSGARGRETKPGPVNLNWKSPGRYSTVNPTWFMKWYFNIRNAEGVALHAYALPGRPASHGCIRLLERDAVWLFNWGDEWTLDRNGRIQVPGTPVLIIGRYDFNAPPPWRDLTALGTSIVLPDLSPDS